MPVGRLQNTSARLAGTTAPMRRAFLLAYGQVPTGPVRSPSCLALARNREDYRRAEFLQKLPCTRHEDIPHLRIVHLDHPDLVDRIDTDGQQSRLS